MKITRRRVLAVLLFCSIGRLQLLLLAAGAILSRGRKLFAHRRGAFHMGGATTEPPSGTRAVLNLCEMKDRYECEIQVWDPIRDSAPAPQRAVDWLKRKSARSSQRSDATENDVRSLLPGRQPQRPGRRRVLDARAPLEPRGSGRVHSHEAARDEAEPGVPGVAERMGARAQGVGVTSSRSPHPRIRCT